MSSFDWIGFGALVDIGSLIRGTLSDGQTKDFIGGDRIDAIAETTERRCRFLREMAMAQRQSDAAISTEGDVEENIAEDYTPKMTM